MMASLSARHPSAWALQEIEITDDRLYSVAVSAKDVNVIVAPAPVQQAVTSKPDIEVKTQGRYVLVTTGAQGGELVLLTDTRHYVLQLKPDNRAAETIILVEQRAEMGSRAQPGAVRSSTAYVDELATLAQAGFRRLFPPGFSRRETPKEHWITWLELTVLRDEQYESKQWLVRRIELLNQTSMTQTLRESQFYTGREAAIALLRPIIDPGQSTILVLITPRPNLSPPAGGAP
jgi:hypothetical protein